MTQSRRILLLSAYHAASHRYWCDQLQRRFPEHQWTLLTLPPRYFSWRIRGNSLSWAFGERERLEADYDLLLATSMVDLASLRGFISALARIPNLVYFHENQFAYPRTAHAHPSVEPQMVNLYSALCGERLLFNSRFNRDTFLAGAEALLKRLPDAVPRGLVTELRERSEILPVPLTPAPAIPAQVTADWGDDGDRSLRIVWNGRHEYDKGPERLLAILQALRGRGLNFRLALLGQQFAGSPPLFGQIRRAFSAELAQFGFIASRAAYWQWLASADVVLSTAVHEFQGLAVLEAIAAGCVPVLPARLAYPEWVGDAYLYASHADDVAREADAAVDLLYSARELAAPDVSHLSWSCLHSEYQRLLSRSEPL